ncbi:MAG: hypothetical protein K0M40_02610 [Prolixibacteraceae bacterium]|nr:hypothetical protein [Prolixibacteraceae bacterium]
MKSKFNLTIALLLVSTMIVGAAGAEYSKTLRKAWPKSGVTALKVTNKFGEVKINDMGGDSVTIKVVITVENPTGAKAKELMNMIEVSFQKSGSMVIAETQMDDNFKSKQSFRIDYLINIPKDRELDITNRYGNVIVNELEAKGTFNVSYGNLTAGNLKAPSGSPVSVVVNYGKADIESINVANMEFKYSKLYAGEIGQIVLDTKYSTVNLHKTGNLTLNSKYDGINIDEIDKLKSVSKYTNYKIGVLTGSFDLDTGYGSVRISNVDSKFDKINIVNSYGGINIGLNELNYKLKAECSYCDVVYPTNRYKGDKIRDGQRVSLEGNVGTGGGSVTINSRYGGVKLTE